jgi:hypothetical protein
MTYNIEKEFPKIVNAFERVKYDVANLLVVVAESEEKQKSQEATIRELRNKISQLNSQKTKTIVRTIAPKTVTKRVNIGEKIAIVGNKPSKKAHRETCPYAKNIKKENFVKFRSKMDAFKKGYSACSCLEGKARGKR